MDRTRQRPVNGPAPSHHHEIMCELRALRSLVKPAEEASLQMIEGYKAQIAEAQKLKAELDLIYDAINRTKEEIAAVHLTGFKGPEMARVTNELDAIVGGTESATEGILTHAEEIDQMASTLAARLKDEQNQALVAGYAGPRRPDLRGLQFPGPDRPAHHQGGSALKFIETHILRMMEIWGGLDAFKDIEAETIAQARGRRQAAQRPEARGRRRPRLAGRHRRAVCLGSDEAHQARIERCAQLRM